MTTTPITHPVLIGGMSDADYHGDPVPGGSLSSTFARLLTDNVPAKAFELRTKKPTRAMDLGKAAHTHALGTGPTLLTWQHDGRTKAGKAERAAYADEIAAEVTVAVTAEQREQIEGMAAALTSDERIAKILRESAAEVSGFVQEGDVWLRARFDVLGDRAAYDYKTTTTDASRRGFSKSMGSFGYHQQGDFYQRVLQALGHPAGAVPLRFIVQETTPPYLVQIHVPDAWALDVAHQLNDRAIRVYAEAKASGVWPGYERLTAEPTPLPAFYFHDHEDVLPDEWRASEEIE